MLEKCRAASRSTPAKASTSAGRPYGFIAVKIPQPPPAKRAKGKNKSRLAPDPMRGPVVEQIFT
jgi:hypothetical protein